MLKYSCIWSSVLLTTCVITVYGEWDDLLRSPFLPKKTHDHAHDNDYHPVKHVHHDPRGDRIIPSVKKVSGSCGEKPYIPRSHICCNNKLHRRQGMRPACCGGQLYDFVFDLCCDDKVRPRTVGRPTC